MKATQEKKTQRRISAETQKKQEKEKNDPEKRTGREKQVFLELHTATNKEELEKDWDRQ